MKHFFKLFIQGGKKTGWVVTLVRASCLHVAGSEMMSRSEIQASTFFYNHYYFREQWKTDGEGVSVSLPTRTLRARRDEVRAEENSAKRKNQQHCFAFFRSCTCWNQCAKSPESWTDNWNHNAAFLDSVLSFLRTCRLAWKLSLGLKMKLKERQYLPQPL